ncbi:MAG TPA: helix-turn-helix transcriptional regulator [Longimicrobiales bacterium]|nr:helix-turn-helix transcriptional regulator [Longimicrobiales bacterium]
MPDHNHLTDLEQILLLSVLRLRDGAHGGAIQADLDANANRRVSLGSIHMTLGRLEARGLARSQKGEPRGTQGGKARRLYTVTEAGRVSLEWGRDILDRMWDGVPVRGGT